MKTNDGVEITGFESLYFAQGEEAAEMLEILDNYGPTGVLERLAQYGYLESDGGGRFTSNPPWGTCDDFQICEEYAVSWNFRYGYIAVSRVITY